MDDSLPPNPYKTLNVPQDASLVTIRSAHRKLVLSCHPDRVQDESTRKQKAEQFHRVQRAYEILSDDRERQRYDEKIKLVKRRAKIAEERVSLSAQRSDEYASRSNESTRKFEMRSSTTYETKEPVGSENNEPDVFAVTCAEVRPSTPRIDHDTISSSRIWYDPNGGSHDQVSGPSYNSSYFLAPPSHHPQQQKSNAYQYTQGYQTLRPPPLNAGHPSNGYPLDRALSRVSNDSGYATRTPSVNSPRLQQSYPIQSYPIQSYVPSRQLSQQSADFSYANQWNPDIEVVHGAPIASSKYKKQRRLRATSPSEYPCLYPNCGHISSQASNLKRHMTVHFPPAVEDLLRCKYNWCGRTGAHGFKREDHRREHYRKVHMKESEYPKTRGGGRKNLGRRSSPAASTTHLSVILENENKHMQIKTRDRKSAAREESVPPSGHHHPSGLLTEDGAGLGNLQLPNSHANPPDHESAKLKLSFPDPYVVISEALDANTVGPMECEHRHPTETGLDRNEASIASTSRHSKKEKLAVIKTQVLEALIASETGQYCASLKVQWDILGFMEDQFRDNDFPNTALGPVVTISGSAQHAQATTCSEYIQRSWPVHGSRILDALQDALDSPTHTSQSKVVARIDNGSLPRDGAPSSHAELKFDVTQENLVLNIKSGTTDIIVDVVQQLTWMGAALRTSTNGLVQYCESELEGVLKAKGTEPAIFNVTFDMSSPGEEDQSCWFPLFTNPVIAHGFPTAHRSDDEVGLEIPLDMMAALGGARHAVDFEGGLVLKGYSALIVPIRRHEKSVQWHLIRARGEDRIPYREASVQFPNRALLKDLNHEALMTTRAYLGWWKEAETYLGTANIDYYESIDWSKAKEASPSPRLTGGTLGVSKIISAQVSFVLGAKDGSFHYSQQEPFQKTIDRAENLPVVLYDQKDRRAWLVPALPVILHIIQLRNHTRPFVVGGKKIQISPVDPSRQGNAAREAVIKNKSQKLFDCESNEEKEYYFRNAVLDAWSILDRLMEREATAQATPGMAVHATWQSTLYGWEFRAVTEEDRHLKQKAQVLEKTAGRWYDLVKDVDAVVLFASGLGDIIKPRSDLGGLCQKWRRLPTDKDYLAVCVSMLEMFYAKAGHRQDHQYLTSAKLQWHRGSVLFEKCAGIASNCCKCDRLQQVYHDSYKIIGHRTPPGNLEANGCVVFGQAHHSMKPITKPLAKSGPLYTLSNDHIHSPAISRSSSTPEDHDVPSGLISHCESFYNENDRTRTPSPERPRSPLWGSNDLQLSEYHKPRVKRRRLPHPETASLDMNGALDEAIQEVFSPSPPKYHTEQENATLVKNTNGRANNTKRSRRLSVADDRAHVTVPRINGYTALGEPCQHLNGCSCRSRFMAHLESR